MQNILIGRFDQDPQAQAQGVIRPEDGRWQLVLDKDGYPHLYVEVHLDDVGDGKPGKGLLAIDDLIGPDLTIRELMSGGSFGGSLPPEEEEAAFQEYLESRAANPVPCPR